MNPLEKPALLLAISAISLLLGSEIGLAWARFAFVHASRLAFESPVAFQPGNFFTVAGAPYFVDFWCTPTVLWLGAALLLYTSRPDARAYLRGLALVLPLGALAMVLNVVFSIALNQRGISWTWAHYPGLSLVYTAIFLLCLRREKVPSGPYLDTLGQEVKP